MFKIQSLLSTNNFLRSHPLVKVGILSDPDGRVRRVGMDASARLFLNTNNSLDYVYGRKSKLYFACVKERCFEI